MTRTMNTATVHRRSSLCLARRGAGFALLAALATGTAACGSSSSAPTSSPSTTAASPASAVQLTTAAFPGVGSVLVGPSGRTVYYLSTETASAIRCTGTCVASWPPVLVGKGAAISGVPGTIGTATRPDGTTQLTYQGHPVYTYQGDNAPGQDNGQGVGGTWFVLKISAAATTTTTGRAGYGY